PPRSTLFPYTTLFRSASEELYCGDPMPPEFMSANIKMVDETARLFPRVPLMLAITDQDVGACRKIAQRGMSKAKAGFLVKFNSLSERTQLDSPHVKLQIELCK